MTQSSRNRVSRPRKQRIVLPVHEYHHHRHPGCCRRLPGQRLGVGSQRGQSAAGARRGPQAPTRALTDDPELGVTLPRRANPSPWTTGASPWHKKAPPRLPGARRTGVPAGRPPRPAIPGTGKSRPRAVPAAP